MSALLEATRLEPEGQSAVPRLSVRELGLVTRGRVVLDDVSFDVSPGEVVALVGPPSAGKSSIVRCVAGWLRPARGTVHLDGRRLARGNRVARAKMGVVLESPAAGVDLERSVLSNLIAAGRLFGVPKRAVRDRAEELLAFFELGASADEPVSALPAAAVRRLELARALIHGPSVLVLDAPTAGLDGADSDPIWGRLLALRDAAAGAGGEPLSVLVATDRPAEADRCDRVVVLDRGRVVACEAPRRLWTRTGGDVVSIQSARPVELARDLRQSFELEPRVEGDAVVVEVDRGQDLVRALVDAFPPGRLGPLTLRKPSVADAFFHLTGTSMGRVAAEADGVER